MATYLIRGEFHYRVEIFHYFGVSMKFSWIHYASNGRLSMHPNRTRNTGVIKFQIFAYATFIVFSPYRKKYQTAICWHECWFVIFFGMENIVRISCRTEQYKHNLSLMSIYACMCAMTCAFFVHMRPVENTIENQYTYNTVVNIFNCISSEIHRILNNSCSCVSLSETKICRHEIVQRLRLSGRFKVCFRTKVNDWSMCCCSFYLKNLECWWHSILFHWLVVVPPFICAVFHINWY